jgi:hypothetical protein
MTNSEVEAIKSAFYLTLTCALLATFVAAILLASVNARGNTIRALCADMAEVGVYSGTCEPWGVRHRDMAQEGEE